MDDRPATTAPAPQGSDEGTPPRRATGRRDRFTGRLRLTVEEDAGTQYEEIPLSLMRPEPGPGAPAVDPRLAPPRLTDLTPPRTGLGPRDLGPDVRHADGSPRPFTFPAGGYDVRGMVGYEHVLAASQFAIATADGTFGRSATPGQEIAVSDLNRAQNTTLTRVGAGSAQVIEDGTSESGLAAGYHQAVTPDAYRLPATTERGPVGSHTAQLDLHARPDFSQALLLTVADGMKMEVLHRFGQAVGTAVGQEDIQDSALGAGLWISSPQTGLNQFGLAGTGPYAGDGGGVPAAADQVTSLNVKPKTGRVFLFAVPTTWISVAHVHRSPLKVSARTAAGTFGHVRPGPGAALSQTYALTWIRDDVARDLGLITDRNFPAVAGAAWDAVGKAGKAWVAADVAYLTRRRQAGPLFTELDAADRALEEARADLRALAPPATVERAAVASADEAVTRALAEERADLAAGRREARAAREALDALDGMDPGEVAHDGWAELLRDQVAAARAALTAAERAAATLAQAAAARVAAAREAKTAADTAAAPSLHAEADATLRLTRATGRADRAHAAYEGLRAELATLRRAAEDAATAFHDVRAGADQLTRWHQEAATEEGRARLGDLAEPPAVTFTAPAAPARAPAAAPRAYTRTTGPGGTLLASPSGRTRYALPPDTGTPPDGDGFFHALTEGLAHLAPGALAEAGVDRTDRPVAVARLRSLLATQLTQPANVDLLEALAPDVTDTFTDAEATGAGLDLDGPGGPPRAGVAASAARREFDALGGLVPHSVTPDAATRARLGFAQLTRPGDAPGERGWNHAAADLLPLLAARTFGADITVVGADGRFQRFGTGERPGAARLRELLDETPGPRPHLVLDLSDWRFRFARPLDSDPPPLPPLPPAPPAPRAKSDPPAAPPPPPPATPPVATTSTGTPAEKSTGKSVEGTAKTPSSSGPPKPPATALHAPAAASPTRAMPPAHPVVRGGTSTPLTSAAGNAAPTSTAPTPPTAPAVPAGTRSDAPGDIARSRTGPDLTGSEPADPDRTRAKESGHEEPDPDREKPERDRGGPGSDRDKPDPDRDKRPGHPLGSTPARGRPVPVPGPGERLLYALLASDPEHVRASLPGLATTHPDAYAWLADPATVRADLTALAAQPPDPEGAPTISTAAAASAVAALRTLVADRLRASGGRPSPRAIAQLRAATAGHFADRAATLDAPALRDLLRHHGATDAELAGRADAELLAELTGRYAASRAPLDPTELADALEAVENWGQRGMPAYGEVLPELLAYALDARIEIARNGRVQDTARRGRATAPRVIEVHHSGLNHYAGSSADPRDLRAFGDPVPPKRVKPEERDDGGSGDIRLNPLWVPLDGIPPALLVTDAKDAVWLYTVTGEGRVLLGSEEPAAIIPDEQFEALLAGMRAKDPELTAESLRASLTGLGHTGVATEFDADGRTLSGASRVSGEFRWNADLGRWTVNDKSGRYMSDAVRPGLDAATAAGWLANVASLFSARLGVEVVPDQLKTAAPPPPAPAPPQPPPTAAPTAPAQAPPPTPKAPVPAPAPTAPATTLPPATPATTPSSAVTADLFARALLDALERGGDAGVGADVRAGGVGSTPGQASITDLRAVGVELTAGQEAQAVLLGGSLEVAELELTPEQRLWLVLRWGAPSRADLDAALLAAATALGVAWEVEASGEPTRRLGPRSAPTVRLFFDGTRFTLPGPTG
ncbi:hypothetical protein [Streptomyces sp. NPDC057676]